MSLVEKWDIVSEGIKRIQSDIPHLYNDLIVLTQPERQNFPYIDWYRGQYMCSIPIIAEREAGFFPRKDVEKQTIIASNHAYPQHCFRPSTLTTYPCYPDCTEPFKRYDRTLQRNNRLFIYR